MWSPTHVQVIVQRAKGLLTKGKNKTNDCFVTIGLGKEKYQTSVKEKAAENVEWHEECELQIPQQGNTAEIVLTALHRNFIGVDEFLGTVRIPLSSFDIYEMPKNRWYELNGKPGKENTKERGKLEVRIGFIVRAGSLTDLTKKERHKSSLGQLSSAAQSFGGSLLSIGSLEKRKGLKKLAKSIGSKVKGKSKSKNRLDDINDEEEFRVQGQRPRTAGQEQGDADPGVVSDEEDEFTFDDLSHKSSTSSLNSSAAAQTTNWKNSENLARVDSPRLNARDMSNNSNNNNSSSNIQTIPQPPQQQQPAAPVSTPPSKPPRFALNGSPKEKDKSTMDAADEWGQKLYGGLPAGTLKRWENKRMSPKIVIDEPRDSSDGALERSGGTGSPISRVTASLPRDAEPPPSAAPRNLPQQLRKDKELAKETKRLEKKEKKEKKENLQKSSAERIIIGGEETSNNGGSGIQQNGRLPREIIEQFEGRSREDLIELVLNLQLDVADKKKRLHDLEDYIDALLLRVIESSPRLLQNPYQPTRRLSSPGNQ